MWITFIQLSQILIKVAFHYVVYLSRSTSCVCPIIVQSSSNIRKIALNINPEDVITVKYFNILFTWFKYVLLFMKNSAALSFYFIIYIILFHIRYSQQFAMVICSLFFTVPNTGWFFSRLNLRY